MSGVNQLHQLFWCAVSAGGSKEGSDLVSKRSIVCMLLNGHQLNDVVSKLLDSRESIRSEFWVSSNPVLSGANTNMGFIDTSRLGLWGPRVLEDIFLWGIPENSVVGAAHGEILGNTFDPSWKAVKYFAARDF